MFSSYTCCLITILIIAVILLYLSKGRRPAPMPSVSVPYPTQNITMLKDDKNWKIATWNGYSIMIGDKEIMSKMMIPYTGMIIEKDDFVLFRRLEHISTLTPKDIEKLVNECVYKGMYDLAIAWDEDYEMACSHKDYLLHSIKAPFDGFVIREGSFLHLFTHNCKNLSKEKMMKFKRENLNKNEVGYILIVPSFIVLYYKEEVAEKYFHIPRDLMIVALQNERDCFYIYDIPFRVKSYEEILQLALEALTLHAEVGVLFTYKGKSFTLLKRYLINMMDDSQTFSGDIIQMTDENGESKMMYVEWTAWTQSELEKIAEEMMDSL